MFCFKSQIKYKKLNLDSKNEIEFKLKYWLLSIVFDLIHNKISFHWLSKKNDLLWIQKDISRVKKQFTFFHYFI